jgi:hypothetical protein
MAVCRLGALLTLLFTGLTLALFATQFKVG